MKGSSGCFTQWTGTNIVVFLRFSDNRITWIVCTPCKWIDLVWRRYQHQTNNRRIYYCGGYHGGFSHNTTTSSPVCWWRSVSPSTRLQRVLSMPVRWGNFKDMSRRPLLGSGAECLRLGLTALCWWQERDHHTIDLELRIRVTIFALYTGLH